MINVAYAASAVTGGGESGFMLIVLTAIVAMLYFTVVRPQQQQARAHDKLIKAVAEGDEVITKGGIYGQVIAVSEGVLRVKLGSDLVVQLQRSAVVRLLPKGSFNPATKD
jgi:preprotein translocase subunit YajC